MSSSEYDSDDDNAMNEKRARKFLVEVTGDKRFKHRKDSLQSLLEDGVILCKLLNRIKHGIIPKINSSSSNRFLWMGNVKNYLKGCQVIGVPLMYMFVPLDLVEGNGMNNVVMNILQIKDMIDKGQLTISEEDAEPFSPSVHHASSSLSSPPATPTSSDLSPSHHALSQSTSSTPLSPSRGASTPSSLRQSSPNSPLRSPSPVKSSSPNSSPPKDSKVSRTNSCTADLGGEGQVGKLRKSSMGASSSLSNLAFAASRPVVSSDVTTSDQDMKIKEELKYSVEIEEAVKEWICAVLKNDKLFEGNITFTGALQNGVTLCMLMNELKPGTIPRIHQKAGAFAMQNVLAFTRACSWIGLPKTQIFSPGDLMDGKNAGRVLDTLHHLARHAISRKLTTVNIRDTSNVKTLYTKTLEEVKGETSYIDEGDPSLEECSPEHKPLLDWVNRQLEKAVDFGEPETVLYNFTLDVRSGLKLLRLAEILIKEPCFGLRYEAPTKIQECMHNACLLFSFVEQRKSEQIMCCTAQDVVRGSEPRVVALVEYLRECFDLDYAFTKLILQQQMGVGDQEMDADDIAMMNTMFASGTLDKDDAGNILILEDNESVRKEEEMKKMREKAMQDFMRLTMLSASAKAEVGTEDFDEEDDEEEGEEEEEESKQDEEEKQKQREREREEIEKKLRELKQRDEERRRKKEEEERERKKKAEEEEEERKKKLEEEQKKKSEEEKPKMPSPEKKKNRPPCIIVSEPTSEDSSSSTPVKSERSGRSKRSGHRPSSTDLSHDGKKRKKRTLSCDPDSAEAATESGEGGRHHHHHHHHHRSRSRESQKSFSSVGTAGSVPDEETAKPCNDEDNKEREEVKQNNDEGHKSSKGLIVNPPVSSVSSPPPTLPLAAIPLQVPAIGPIVPAAGSSSSNLRRPTPMSPHSRRISVTQKQMQNILKAHAQMRRRVANEILSTEESYVTGLATLCDKVVDPLIDLSHSWNSGPLSHSPMTEKEVLGIFSNVKELRADHDVFLKKLRERFKDWNDDTTVIGDLFLDQLKYFERYAPYLQNYASASNAYHYIYAHSQVTKSLVDDFEKEQYAINKLNVPSFIVLPVQRLPRYVMLLSDLLKYTPKEHPDNPLLQKVCAELPLLVANINKTIDPARAASMQTNIQIASNIAGDGTDIIVRCERKFMYKIPLKKVTEEYPSKRDKTHRKGMLYVFDSLLVVCTKTTSSKTAREQPFTLISAIPLNNISNLVLTEKEIILSPSETGSSSKKTSERDLSRDTSKYVNFRLTLLKPSEATEAKKQLSLMIETARKQSLNNEQ